MDRTQQFEALAAYGIFPFYVGQVTHKLLVAYRRSPDPKHSWVSVQQPTRLSAMLLDYSRFVDRNPDSWYQAGAIAFSVDRPLKVRVQLTIDYGRIDIDARVRRPSIVRHAVLIMQEALAVRDGLSVTLDEDSELRHVGLGSSPSIQVAVASAINYLYGNPIPTTELIEYLARNYGEEIDGDNDRLLPVQSMGAAAAVGCAGGMVIVAGKATLIAHMPLPETHKFVIGIPQGYGHLDAVAALSQDITTYPVLQRISADNRHFIAYDILHSMLPAMVRGDISTIGTIIRKHRLSEEQLTRFEMRYPGKKAVLHRLIEFTNHKKIDILSVSSTGPTIFAFTSFPDEVDDYFKQQNFRTIIALPNNTGLIHTYS